MAAPDSTTTGQGRARLRVLAFLPRAAAHGLHRFGGLARLARNAASDHDLVALVVLHGHVRPIGGAFVNDTSATVIYALSHTTLFRSFLLELILLLIPALNFLPVWFALSLQSEPNRQK